MKLFNSIKNGSLFTLSVLIFVGCNTENNSQHQTNAMEKKETYTPKSYTVEIKQMQFQPADITVHQGDTIVWINKDIVVHDITEVNKAWTSAPLLSDSTWKKVISKSESYFCSIHVVMKGKIILEE